MALIQKLLRLFIDHVTSEENELVRKGRIPKGECPFSASLLPNPATRMPLAEIPKQFNETAPNRSAIRMADEKSSPITCFAVSLFHALLEFTPVFGSRLGIYVLNMDAVPCHP